VPKNLDRIKSAALRIDSDHTRSIAIAMPRQLIRSIVVAYVRRVVVNAPVEILRLALRAHLGMTKEWSGNEYR